MDLVGTGGPPEYNPYAPPAPVEHVRAIADDGHAERARFQAYEEGDVLVFERTARLPKVCTKCGTRERVTRKPQRFQWTPRWAPLLFVFCNIAGLVALLVARKRATVDLPLCEACRARWKQARIAGGVAVAAFLVELLLVRETESLEALVMGFVVGLTVLLAVGVGFCRPRVLRSTRIEEIMIKLAGVHPSARRAIVAYAQRR